MICKYCNKTPTEPTESAIDEATRKYFGFCDSVCHYRYKAENRLHKDQIEDDRKREESDKNRSPSGSSPRDP